MIAARSISSRLTLWFSSVFFAGLILFGAVMWFDLKDTLMTGRERTLDRRADRLSDLLRDTAHDPPNAAAERFRTFADATGGGLIEILNADGTRALDPPSAAEAFPWPAMGAWRREQFREVDFEGQSYLVLARPFSLASRALVLCVAAPLEGNRPILRTFSLGLLWTVPAMLLLSALGGYALSCRALKPVDEITSATRSISISNLSQRLPVPRTRDELQRLSETCNAMLARLESTVNEIQRFTADASHELRSPLSFIRTVAEVALRNRNHDIESRRAFEEIVEECSKASRVLEDLLTLARADAGGVPLPFEPVDLMDVVSAVCEKAGLLAAARQHTLTISLDGGTREHAPVRGDYSSLRRLVWILVENAVKYTPPRGRIEVAVRVRGDRALVSVKDNGIGISPADLPHLFERFYRADPSRSRQEGSGLGLAIAKWIAGVHEASVSVESRPGAGSVFELDFPVLKEACSQVPVAAV
jgi:heavy metal sensor kinase